jgi:signal peptidase I
VTSPYAPPASSPQPGAAGAASPGSPAIAAILSLLSLGTGHVYAAEPWRAFGFFGASALAVALWGVLFRPLYLTLGLAGVAIPLVLPAAIYVLAAFDAAKRARTRPVRYPVWLVAVAFVAFSIFRGFVASGLRFFFVEAFKIPSGGDVPTLMIGDHTFVDKLTPRRRPPQRGELIVFPFPEHPDQDFVKRVVGLPGDTVQTTEDGVLLNGWPVPRCKVGRLHYADESMAHDGDVWVEFLGESSYLIFEDAAAGVRTTGTWHVKPGELFVMGDNRENSHDSRMWYGGAGGGVPIRTVRGMPLTVWMSLDPQGQNATERVGADLTGRKPLAPKALEDGLAKCLAGRPPGNVGP